MKLLMGLIAWIQGIVRSVRRVGSVLIRGGHVVVMTGTLSAAVIRADGTIKRLGVIARKKVTTAFVNYLSLSLTDQTTYPINIFKYHDSGIGTNAESNADVALQTPTGDARVAGTQVIGGSANIYRTVATITYSVGKAVTEHGVFSLAAAGTLMDRSVFSAINVGAGESIQFTYELTSTAEA
jgi:hypothetical protein